MIFYLISVCLLAVAMINIVGKPKYTKRETILVCIINLLTILAFVMATIQNYTGR